MRKILCLHLAAAACIDKVIETHARYAFCFYQVEDACNILHVPVAYGETQSDLDACSEACSDSCESLIKGAFAPWGRAALLSIPIQGAAFELGSFRV